MSALPNLETLALRWCPKAERVEVTRTGDRSVRVVVAGAKIEEADGQRLASLLTFRLLPLGVAVDVEARSLEYVPVVEARRPAGFASKLNAEVLAALAEAPLTRAQLAYKLRIGPRNHARQRSLTNSLYHLERTEHRIVLKRNRRYALTAQVLA